MNNDKIVLLCCSGRSGSTTLQQIINTIPNSNICGENYGAINSILLFYKKIKQTTLFQVHGHKTPVSYEKLIENGIKPAWYNSYNFEEIKESTRNLIIQMFKKNMSTNLWGFKEIRYDNGNINLIPEFKELFPNTKIIIQIREDIDKQSKSSWMKNDPNSKKYLFNLNNELEDFYKKNQDYIYFTTFEKMFDMDNLKKIFKFIDSENDFNEVTINHILNNNLKSKGE
jgi:hypothetical protein